MKIFYVLLSCVVSSQLFANESLQDAFVNGEVKALARYGTQHRDTNYHVLQDAPSFTPTNAIQSYSALGGYLGYQTAPFFGLSLGATLYTSHPLGNNADDRKGLGGLDESKGGQDAYSVLGEAFIEYQKDKHFLKIGRQEIADYKFVSLSNIRMTPFTHEGIIYENSSLDKLKLHFGYLTGQKDRNSEAFQGMIRSARVNVGSGENTNIRGEYNPSNYDSYGNYSGASKDMPLFGLSYKYSDGTVDIWNYFVGDFVNTIYCYADYNFSPTEGMDLSFAGQYASQYSIGQEIAGTVDTWFYGLKAQARLEEGLLFFVAYNEVSYNENSYDGGTLFVRWGTPKMFNSFQVQDSELAGTRSLGMGVQFDLGTLGIADSTVIRFRYANYNMPDKLWMRDASQDRSESTFDLRYAFSKDSGFGIFTQLDGLSLQLRVAYDNFKTDYNIPEYQKTHGYNAYSVTSDFVDARLYLDYVF